MPFHYATEDAQLLLELLEEGRYDAVVGNPPYIQPPDKALNKIYRSKFGKVCKGTYHSPSRSWYSSSPWRSEESDLAGWVRSRATRSWTANLAFPSSRTSFRLGISA